MPALHNGGAAASYRLQLTPTFGFAQAAEAVPYLAELGVTHLYLSPILEATPGSTHGYDVTDPTKIRDAFGGGDGFDSLASTASAAGLRLILDVVPNHMAANEHNAWWSDALANGEHSDGAVFFDVDWDTGDGRIVRGPPRDRINYRRFFEIDDLAALRQEDRRVFLATHGCIAQLAARDEVAALRIDHVDGLRDPRGYLHDLAAAAPSVTLFVEKILEGDERLPSDWPVAGTTGYEFAHLALGLFVDPSARDALADGYARLTGDQRSWPEAVLEAKRHVLGASLAPDVRRVARAMGDEELASAIAELAARWPVYRTYLHGDEGVERLQLLTGPAMAKGVEDRAFYNFTRFVALNDVGGNPDRFGVSREEWHATCEEVAARTPFAMRTTATHDTKRGEDVRARLAVLSERADWWLENAEAWLARHDAIDGPTAYLLLQTIVGAWPVDEERLTAYMEKAAREAGSHTTWAEPDANYEEALRDTVRAALADAAGIDALVAPLVGPGRTNALAQLLLRLTAPGTPDTYQGTEAWDLSLVDPDNRREVDYQARARLLKATRASSPEEWLRRADDSWPKMAVLDVALHARREFPEAFAGAYSPLETDSDAVLAFARADKAVVVVPRCNATRRPTGDVALPPGRWTNRFTGDSFAKGRVDAAELLARFPVALLCP